MAQTDLVERIRQYGSFLDESMRKIATIVERERQMNPNTYHRQEDARKLAEVFGQETAYKNTLREFKERFPELYTSVQKTK